jgi:hypothetical protein
MATGSDTSLFVLRHGTETTWLLLYVDDIVTTASSTALLQQIVVELRSAFAMKDLGPLHYFLGIQVRRTVAGFFLHQQQYAEDKLEHSGMLNCKPALTPVDTKAKVSASAGTPLTDKTFYCSIVSALQYLTLTRPELVYAVQQACLHMHDPMTLTGTSSNRFCDMSVSRRVMVFYYAPYCPRPSQPTRMLTGRVAQIRDALRVLHFS